MKGYAMVAVTRIQTALTERKKKADEAEEIRAKGIQLLYDKHVTNGSWYAKWKAGNKSPSKWARGKIEMFGCWSDILGEVLTSDENDEIHRLSWGYHCEEASECKSLINAVDDDCVLLDSNLCKFVNRYAGDKQ